MSPNETEESELYWDTPPVQTYTLTSGDFGWVFAYDLFLVTFFFFFFMLNIQHESVIIDLASPLRQRLPLFFHSLSLMVNLLKNE